MVTTPFSMRRYNNSLQIALSNSGYEDGNVDLKTDDFYRLRSKNTALYSEYSEELPASTGFYIVATIPGISPAYTNFTVTLDGNYLYVPSILGNRIYVVSTQTNTLINTINDIHLGYSPYPLVMAPDDDLAYILGWDGIYIISTTSHNVQSTISIANSYYGLISPNGQVLYISHDYYLAEISTISNSIINDIGFVGILGMVLTPDGNYIYGISYDGQMEVYNTENSQVIETIPIDSGLKAQAITSDGLYIVVACSNNAYIISTETNSTLGMISCSGYQPTITPNDEFAYIPHCTNDYVSVISLITFDEIMTIDVGECRERCQITNDGNYAIFSVANPHEIIVIDTNTNIIIGRYSLPGYPYGKPAITPDDNQIYIGSGSPDSITVLRYLH